MREILSDVVRQTVGLFDSVKVTGTATETKIEAMQNRTLFLKAFLHEPQPKAIGEWGLSDLTLLNGLLNYGPYKAEGSRFEVKRRAFSGGEAVEQFEFYEAGGVGAVHRALMGSLVGAMPTIPHVAWDVSVPAQKEQVAAFTQLSGLARDIGKVFGVETKDGNLVFTFGERNSSSHCIQMIFASDITGTVQPGRLFSATDFLAVVKHAGTHPITVNMSQMPTMALIVTTPVATYTYYLRATI